MLFENKNNNFIIKMIIFVPKVPFRVQLTRKNSNIYIDNPEKSVIIST